MSNHTIQKTIQLVAKAMMGGVLIQLIKKGLLLDGFEPRQVEVMIRWAKKIRDSKKDPKALEF